MRFDNHFRHPSHTYPTRGQGQEATLFLSIFKWVFGGIALAFAFTSLAILCVLWALPIDLLFKIVFSIVDVPFVAIGGTLFVLAVKIRPSIPTKTVETVHDSQLSSEILRLHCPQCGAPFEEDAETSSSGDVKCEFCDSWYNVYQQS